MLNNEKKMSDASLIETCKSAIKNNIQFIQQYIGGKVKISSVVKSNAYGHGFKTFVPIVKEAGINHYSIFSSSKAKKIATIPVEYASGFSRVLSNNGNVLINGQRVDVIGMVNMNMVIADMTQLKKVKIGDEVILIGTQKDLTISVSSFGELSSLLNYELLTRLPLDIKRTIVN